MIRIVIADDHKIVREGLKQILALAPDIGIVGEAASAEEVMRVLSQCDCDLLVLDMTMPGLSGVELIKRIKARELAPLILVLSMHNEGQLVSRALKAGAAGYMTKDSEPDMLVAAIRKIAAGGRYIDPQLVDEMVFDQRLDGSTPLHQRLSDREFQIFRMLVAGNSITAIAETLSLSAKTVSTHKLRLLQKMNMQSIAELTRYAVEHRLIDL